MRVIAGSAKGRRLQSVPGRGTRPITDRVKKALFDILGSQVTGTRFLDLFAGTGSVGIEALSRGASHATFVESSPRAVRVIERNLSVTELGGNAIVVRDDVFRFLARGCSEAFNIAYIAPPQYRHLWATALKALDEGPHVVTSGLAVVQIFPKEHQPLALNTLELVDQRRYGSTTLCFYLRCSAAPRPCGIRSG